MGDFCQRRYKFVWYNRHVNYSIPGEGATSFVQFFLADLIVLIQAFISRCESLFYV